MPLTEAQRHEEEEWNQENSFGRVQDKKVMNGSRSSFFLALNVSRLLDNYEP